MTVTTVRAIDMDSASVQAPIIYSLEDKVKGQFVINRKTGVITTGKFVCSIFITVLVALLICLLLKMQNPLFSAIVFFIQGVP